MKNEHHELLDTEGGRPGRDEGSWDKPPSAVDEIPMAYQDIDAVMHAQRLVEVVHTLKQVVCVKG